MRADNARGHLTGVRGFLDRLDIDDSRGDVTLITMRYQVIFQFPESFFARHHVPKRR
jgi:hypothetical protein